MLLLFGACKTQRTIAPFVLRDSISITYKQGAVQPLSIYKTEEQPTPTGVSGAAIESRKNSMVSPLNGETVSREGAKVFEGLLSQRTNKKAVPPTTTIRVDTVFVERWHTQTIPHTAPQTPATIPRFYKDCTIGFWILLLLLLGRIAVRIMKAIYLRK